MNSVVMVGISSGIGLLGGLAIDRPGYGVGYGLGASTITLVASAVFGTVGYYVASGVIGIDLLTRMIKTCKSPNPTSKYCTSPALTGPTTSLIGQTVNAVRALQDFHTVVKELHSSLQKLHSSLQWSEGETILMQSLQERLDSVNSKLQDLLHALQVHARADLSVLHKRLCSLRSELDDLNSTMQELANIPKTQQVATLAEPQSTLLGTTNPLGLHQRHNSVQSSTSS